MSTTRRIWTCVLTIGVVLLAFAEDSRALGQEPKAYEKHDQAALYNSLREVINTGARMFNEDGDHAGCFQLYKGSLIAVRPFLAPDLQKSIDAALSKCDRLPSYGDRAFELRCVLDEIRAKTKPGDAKVEPMAETGQVAGKITYQGKAVPGGYFITLVASNGKKHSTAHTPPLEDAENVSTPIRPDTFLDQTLRPGAWDDYVGQESIKNNLHILITAAKERAHPPEHILFYGPPGL